MPPQVSEMDFPDRTMGVGDVLAVLNAGVLFHDPDNLLAIGATSSDSTVVQVRSERFHAPYIGYNLTVTAVALGEAVVTITAEEPARSFQEGVESASGRSVERVVRITVVE